MTSTPADNDYVINWKRPITEEHKKFFSLISESAYSAGDLEAWLETHHSPELASIGFHWRGTGNALHLCAYCGFTEKAKVMIDYAHRCGMRLSQPDKQGLRAQDIAKKQKHFEIVDLIKGKKQKLYQQKNKFTASSEPKKVSPYLAEPPPDL